MSIMLEEETKKSSLVAALQPPLPQIPSKTPPLPPPPVPTPVLMIAADTVVILASVFLDLSTKYHTQSQIKVPNLSLRF